METILKKKIGRESKDYLAITFGLICYALGWVAFSASLSDHDRRSQWYCRYYLLCYRSRNSGFLLCD